MKTVHNRLVIGLVRACLCMCLFQRWCSCHYACSILMFLKYTAFNLYWFHLTDSFTVKEWSFYIVPHQVATVAQWIRHRPPMPIDHQVLMVYDEWAGDCGFESRRWFSIFFYHSTKSPQIYCTFRPSTVYGFWRVSCELWVQIPPQVHFLQQVPMMAK